MVVFFKVSAFAGSFDCPLNICSFPSMVYDACESELVRKWVWISCHTFDFNRGGFLSAGKESNCKVSPISDDTGGLINSTMLSSSVASTIASDLTPLILEGFKLVNTTTLRFDICSRGI